MTKEEVKKYLGSTCSIQGASIVTEDGVVLMTSPEFSKYSEDIIRICYTGSEYGTGDYIAVASDRIEGPDVVIYKW